MIILQVNDMCRPIARGELYEEPLEEFLESNGFGEVTGSGTALQENNDPWYCEVELSINNESNSVITELIKEIERIGVPKGSRLIFEDQQEILIGILEGVVVNLNYTEAPESVLDETDFKALWDGIANAVEPYGVYHDDVNRNGKTTIYYYGKDAQSIVKSVKEKIKGHKLEQFIDAIALPLVIEE